MESSPALRSLLAPWFFRATYRPTARLFPSPRSLAASDWAEAELYTFGGLEGGLDGSEPNSLVRDATGTFYGTTALGGKTGNGTVFKLTPPQRGQTAWTETLLYSFAGGSDGGNPFAPLVFDRSGALYSTTGSGGDQSPYCAQFGGCGTVFKL
jgi:uncharacterized repeat protein (TIGR03803 family)